MCKSELYFRPACGIVVLTSLAQWSVFTRGHGGYVSVPNQSCGIWTLSLCKRFLLFQWICIDAGHVSENTEFILIAHVQYIKILTWLRDFLGFFFYIRFGFLCAQVFSGNCETMDSRKICNFLSRYSQKRWFLEFNACICILILKYPLFTIPAIFARALGLIG